MDTDTIRAVAPHYLALLLVLFVVLTVLRQALGRPNFWLELAVLLVISFLYRPAVQYLGIAPDPWQRG